MSNWPPHLEHLTRPHPHNASRGRYIGTGVPSAVQSKPGDLAKVDPGFNNSKVNKDLSSERRQAWVRS